MINLLYVNILHVVQIFARGGGGGSGGGGGGGGSGGGGGGGGGGVVLIILLGYIPAHFVGAKMRKIISGPPGLVVMLIATLMFSVFWFSLGGFLIIAGIGALLGGPSGYFGLIGKVSMRVRKKAQQDVIAASESDPSWDLNSLNSYVNKTFISFQADWSTFNIQHMQTYLEVKYFNHIQLILQAIQQRKRRNLVDNPVLIEAYPVNIQDFADNSKDTVTYLIHGKADDKLIENVDGADIQLFVDKSEFYEYWNFTRNGENWLLTGISQQTEDARMLRNNISDFASKNGMFYSPDWGWLLLPTRGQLFAGGKFGKSDINNHVIGTYKNILVELYTYIANINSNSSANEQYVIAQAALPKRYDSLMVIAKQTFWQGSMFSRKPKGYNKLSLEWQDFNKRYDVYATNVEQVTAFELLHPVYMEKLFALPFKVNIEVVDNVVYLYTRDMKADYATMYEILKDAFEEMKL